MNFYVFAKVFGDLCLYYGCIGALPALFPYDFFFLWPTLVCAACTGIAAFLSGHGKNAARLPFLLLAAASLMFGRTVMEWLILVPPAAYTISMILRDEWTLEYFHFRDGFRKTLTVMGIALVLVHFGVLIEGRSDHSHVLDSTALLRHILMYTFCGILLQRQLRLGTDKLGDRYLNNIQLALIAVSTGAIVAGIVLAEWFLSSRGISLGQLIGQLLQMIVGVFLASFQQLFLVVAEMIKTAKKLQFDDSSNSDVDPTPVMPMEEMQQLVEEVAQEPAPFPWWLAVLLLVVFAALLILLARALGSRRSEPDRTETVSQIQPKAKEKQPSRRSNRTRLRKVYRDFLKAEKRKGHKLMSWHTSLDIVEELKPGGDPEAAAQLRQLYLSARYDPESNVTPEQVQAAREALKQYKTD